MENMSLKIRRFLPKFSLRDLICRHSVSDSFLISIHHCHYQSHNEAEVPSRHEVDLTKKAKSCHVMLIFGSNHWIVATHQRSSLSLLHQMSIAVIIIFFFLWTVINHPIQFSIILRSIKVERAISNQISHFCQISRAG